METLSSFSSFQMILEMLLTCSFLCHAGFSSEVCAANGYGYAVLAASGRSSKHAVSQIVEIHEAYTRTQRSPTKGRSIAASMRHIKESRHGACGTLQKLPARGTAASSPQVGGSSETKACVRERDSKHQTLSTAFRCVALARYSSTTAQAGSVNRTWLNSLSAGPRSAAREPRGSPEQQRLALVSGWLVQAYAR